VKVKNLWAPWRSQYVGGEREDGCVFCRAYEERDDPERLVVGAGQGAFIVLNKFPYTTGHLMIVPTRHVGALEELKPGEVSELWRLLKEAKRALGAIYSPDGYNVGLNLGEAAGAGITDHLHLHVVPRWTGDTNFMPVFADVRMMPQHMEEVRAALTAEISI
jgi:ATP adenylyltransferase